MSDIICGYAGDRESLLMAYLYDEIPPADREAFEAHIAACARCRVELNGLGGVRAQLARWSAPSYANSPHTAADSGSRQLTVVTPARGLRSVSIAPGQTSDVSATTDAVTRGAWWREVPAWAQVAAALLVLGVSAGIANLDVRYDAQNGLHIRTGWTGQDPQSAQSAQAASVSDDAVSRAELVRLEEQLRGEIRSASVPTAAPQAALVRDASTSDAEVVRRIKALVDESERRQQRELALRVAELMREVNTQRQSDLRKIDQNLGFIQDRTGVEVMRNRQMIDLYLQRVSQRQ